MAIRLVHNILNVLRHNQKSLFFQWVDIAMSNNKKKPEAYVCTSSTFDLQLINARMLNMHACAGKSHINLELENHRR